MSGFATHKAFWTAFYQGFNIHFQTVEPGRSGPLGGHLGANSPGPLAPCPETDRVHTVGLLVPWVTSPFAKTSLTQTILKQDGNLVPQCVEDRGRFV